MTTTINSKTITTVKADDCIYLMCPSDKAKLLDLEKQAKHLADKGGFKKIVGKIPGWGLQPLSSLGYQVEAEVPGMYGGSEDGYFIANYRDPQRKHWDKKEERIINSVKTIAHASRRTNIASDLPAAYSIHLLSGKQALEVVSCYQRAFLDYPDPEDFEAFVDKNMALGHCFAILYCEDQWVEVARLAVYRDEGHAEISDFATHPDFRGRNMSFYLISRLLEDLKKQEVPTVYGLPRASSYGLNITFSKLGFECGGTLRNNRMIGRSLESLNVWHRRTSL